MRTLVAIGLLFSVQAFACPDLTGKYLCTYSDGSTESVEVSQQILEQITVYNYNGSMLRADNLTYSVPDDENLKQGTYRTWCDGDLTLKAELKGKHYNEGAYYGDLTMIVDFSKAGDVLRQVTTGNLKTPSGDYPLNSEMACTLIKN